VKVKTRIGRAPTKSAALGQIALFVFFVGSACNQSLAADLSQTSPELIGQLTKTLSVTPAQASGGAGALFGLAKSRLSAADFSQIAAVVPGIDGLIKSAPASKNSTVPGLSGLEGSLPGGLGGLASTAGSFKKLGLSPEMATKFAPVLVQFVQSKGGANVASLLSGALK
jgi:hypothetical protein